MEEAEDKIIVFESYDTALAANLVKTKLDAYGIPCFLSDEHFVGLFPFRNELFTGVTLHIFERDLEKVKEIMREQHDTDIETLCCPHCGSANIISVPEKTGFLPNLISSLLIGLFIHTKKLYRCASCHLEFNTPVEKPKSSTL